MCCFIFEEENIISKQGISISELPKFFLTKKNISTTHISTHAHHTNHINYVLGPKSNKIHPLCLQKLHEKEEENRHKVNEAEL